MLRVRTSWQRFWSCSARVLLRWFGGARIHRRSVRVQRSLKCKPVDFQRI
ncbi:uncharacterized protein DS421_4g117590 [Arachis hypogaea]|nr:uncharacterized protein DS421_4g117590 [Arachis hypogaea]